VLTAYHKTLPAAREKHAMETINDDLLEILGIKE
jgi:hypothetical protein